MFRLVSTFFLLLMSFQTSATKQIDDTLMMGANTEIAISELPLRNFDSWQLYAKQTEFHGCSASWRGYQAKWRLLEGNLYLTEIIKNPCDRATSERIYAVKQLRTNSDFPIKADWYSGSIKIEIDGKYIYKKGQARPIGRDYDILSLDFINGELKSKKIERVEERNAH